MIKSKIQFVLPVKCIMKKYYYALIAISCMSCIQIDADPTITFFFRPSIDIERMMHLVKQPGHLSQVALHEKIDHSPIAGILAIYSGYITASDYNGEIIFPRKQHRSRITIVITPELYPVMLFENTINHWELVPGVSAAFYLCEQKYNDKTEEYYWEIKEMSVPDDRAIPLESVLIVARPKDIIVPLGITPTRETANLVLPP